MGRAHRFLLARRLATRCGNARVSSTWGRSESAGGVVTLTCHRVSAVSGTQRAASSSRALSPRASRKASLARRVEIVVTTMCARACWAARARFALLHHHHHLVSHRASLARRVEIVVTTMCARACWAARARFALLLHPHLVWLLVRVALLRALVVRSSSAVEGVVARHCTVAMIPFASCEGLNAPSRQSCLSSSRACVRCSQDDVANLTLRGRIPSGLRALLQTQKQERRTHSRPSQLLCRVIHCTLVSWQPSVVKASANRQRYRARR